MKLLGKIEKNADKIGAIGGYVGTYAAVAGVEGVPVWDCLKYRHINAAIHLNFGKAIKETPDRLINDPNGWGAVVHTTIPLYVGAYITKELDLDPKLNRVAKATKTACMSASIMSGVATFVGTMAEGSGGSEKPERMIDRGGGGGGLDPFNGVYV